MTGHVARITNDCLIDYDGVRLCLRTAAIIGPFVHPLGDM
jgi:hypothetical protein